MPRSLTTSALVMLALSIPAFWPQYLSKPGAADGYTHFHAALGVCWLLLLAGQPAFVLARSLRWHRIVGRPACVLGAIFVISGILVAHRAANRMDPAQFALEGHTLYLPLAMAAIFAAALALGIAWRAVPPVHGRFMACTALPLLDPLLARLLYFYFPPLPAPYLYQIPAFLIVSGLLFAMSRSLPHQTEGRRSFLAFSAATVLALLLFFATPSSHAWFEFVHWFRSLPIT